MPGSDPILPPAGARPRPARAGRGPAGLRLRACPDLVLVQLDRLGEHERRLLAAACPEPPYGVLVRRGPDPAAPIALGHEAALLFLTLAEPGPLPGYVPGRFGPGWAATVQRLVLDGVLEVEVGDGEPGGGHSGDFRGGAGALGALGLEEAPDGADGRADGGRAARLSREAVRYAAGLGLTDAAELSVRMYSYNRIPLTAEWLERFGGDRALRAWKAGPPDPRFARAWRPSPPRGGADPWQSWGRASPTQGGGAGVRGAGIGGGFKLYISPGVEHLGETFRAVTAALADRRGQAFKVGRDAAGVLRPDKMVVYFQELEELQHVAAGLTGTLRGVPPHGVPFAADISGDGLLSWGADPPRGGPGAPAESWRLWVTNRLAIALTGAAARAGAGGQDATPAERAAFAIGRVALEGIDPATWAPTQTMWN